MILDAIVLVAMRNFGGSQVRKVGKMQDQERYRELVPYIRGKETLLKRELAVTFVSACYTT